MSVQCQQHSLKVQNTGNPRIPTERLPYLHVYSTCTYNLTCFMAKSCCKQKALICFKHLSQVAIELARSDWNSCATETEQTQYLLSYMRQHSRGDKSILYTVAGQEMCEAGFRMVYGLRYNRFNAIKAKFASRSCCSWAWATWEEPHEGCNHSGYQRAAYVCAEGWRSDTSQHRCSFAILPNQGWCLHSRFWWSLRGWTGLLQTIDTLQDLKVEVPSRQDTRGTTQYYYCVTYIWS